MDPHFPFDHPEGQPKRTGKTSTHAMVGSTFHKQNWFIVRARRPIFPLYKAKSLPIIASENKNENKSPKKKKNNFRRSYFWFQVLLCLRYAFNELGSFVCRCLLSYLTIFTSGFMFDSFNNLFVFRFKNFNIILSIFELKKEDLTIWDFHASNYWTTYAKFPFFWIIYSRFYW